MNHWIVLGGGKQARVQYPAFKADKVIGSNRSLEYAVPDTYWITDPMAIERYRHLWTKYAGEIISNSDLGRPTTRWRCSISRGSMPRPAITRRRAKSSASCWRSFPLVHRSGRRSRN